MLPSGSCHKNRSSLALGVRFVVLVASTFAAKTAAQTLGRTGFDAIRSALALAAELPGGPLAFFGSECDWIEGFHLPGLDGIVSAAVVFNDTAADDAGPDVSAAASADRVPNGLSASDWSGIRAVYEANRHTELVDEGGTRARNPAQQWWTSFDGCGFLTEPDSGGWSWGLELVSYGVEGAERAVDRPQGVTAD